MTRVEAGLDDAQFRRHREALTSEILRPDKNLWERSEFYWQSIAKKQFDFDGREAMAEAVESFSRVQWLDYFKRVFLDQRRSLQVVTPGQWGELPPVAGKRYTSADEIKAGHDTYVIE
jgi:secreted Zn-dependent insulinase-like peptidase